MHQDQTTTPHGGHPWNGYINPGMIGVAMSRSSWGGNVPPSDERGMVTRTVWADSHLQRLHSSIWAEEALSTKDYEHMLCNGVDISHHIDGLPELQPASPRDNIYAKNFGCEERGVVPGPSIRHTSTQLSQSHPPCHVDRRADGHGSPPMIRSSVIRYIPGYDETIPPDFQFDKGNAEDRSFSASSHIPLASTGPDSVFTQPATWDGHMQSLFPNEQQVAVGSQMSAFSTQNHPQEVFDAIWGQEFHLPFPPSVSVATESARPPLFSSAGKCYDLYRLSSLNSAT
jgi:hypothetical protein